MKKKTKIGFSTLLLLFLLISLPGGLLSEVQSRFSSIGYPSTNRGFVSTIYPSIRPSISYESHPPINIDGNEDFWAQATADSWPGEGTSIAPYVIEGFNITDSSIEVIGIKNTDVFFQISNCWVEGGSFGIYLENAMNGEISDNTITNNNQDGIRIENSGSNTIISNTVANNRGTGLFLKDSDRNTISGNIFTGNSGDSIFLRTSENSTIADNTVTNSGVTGIFLLSSPTITITNNTITNNGGEGLFLWSSDNSSIANNTVTNNSGEGIRLDSTRSSNILDNSLSNNDRRGIFLYSSHFNIVIWNDLIGNNPNGISQAYDDGHNNTFTYNYWNEWTAPDWNQDGIVDQPYPIDGSTTNQDDFPRTTPIQGPAAGPLVHIITTSVLLVVILGALGISVRKQRRT